MKLYELWLANLVVLALLKFYYIPRVQRYIEHQRSLAVIGKAATLAFISWIASIVVIAAISGGVVLAASLWVQIGSGATAEQVGKLITSVQQWRGRVGGFGPVWGVVILGMNLLALGIYARRRGRVRMLKAFDAVRQAEIDRLRREAESGRWEDLTPTTEMGKVASRIQELARLAGEIQTGGIDEAEAIKSREHLAKEIESYKELYAQLDIQRRIDLRLSPESAALPVPSTAWERVQTFFISQGLWRSLGGPSRVLYVTNLFLLIPALLGIYSQSAAPVFEQRLLRLTDLQVELSQKEARDAWQQATLEATIKPAEPQSSPTNVRLTAQDVRILKLAARQFENALARSDLFANVAQSVKPGVDHAVRSARTRDRVLNVTADQSPASVIKVPSGAQAETGPTRAEWEFVERGTGMEPITKPGRDIYKDLEAYAQRTPGFLENFIHSFQVSVRDDDLAVSAVRKTVGVLFGDHLGEFGKVLDGLDPQVGLAMQKAVETRAHVYVTEVIRSNGRKATEAFEAVLHPNYHDITSLNLNRFHDFGWHNPIFPDGGDGLIASIRQHPPSIDPKVDPHADLGKAEEQIRRVLPPLNSSWSPHYTADLVQRSTEALADFSTHFPASAETAMKTTQMRAIQEVTKELNGTKGGGTFEGVARILGQAAEGLAQNARSFVRLRGFSRVGGVLIGNEPVDSTNRPVKLEDALRFRDVRWEVDGGRTRFILVDSDGRELVSRWWRTSIAGQALAYAADGRPLAATMVSAKPLLELKILVHAALIDTGLGHRITDLDRFVDEFTGDKNRNGEVAVAREEATAAVCAQNALYAYSWAERAKAITNMLKRSEFVHSIAQREGVDESVIRQFLNRSEEEASRIIQDCEQPSNGNDAKSSAAAGFAAGLQVLDDVERSPLRFKQEFYESSLVEVMAQARRETNSLTEFGRYVRTRFASQSPDLQALATRPPEFTVWSGVREKRFSLKLSDFFVTEGESLPNVLDFMLQVAFTSAPIVDDESYADTRPWEFPALHKKIYRTVADSIKANPSKQAIYDAATEFTLLQRFFRLGFEGFLGDEFPIEKFGDLAIELRSVAPPSNSRTLRWNARPGLLEAETLTILRSFQDTPGFSKSGKGAEAIVVKTLGPILESLDEFEARLDSLRRPAAVSEAGWSAEWSKFSEWRRQWLDQWEAKVKALRSSAPKLSSEPISEDAIKRMIGFLESQTAALRLRESLGVEIDDEQIIRESVQKTLPPLDRLSLGTGGGSY